MGLSPRVRGNQGFCRRERADKRSIPACAGEPRSHYRRNHVHPVYPRVCGGTTLTMSEISAMTRPPGSIPACAGEPGRPFPPVLLREVYPRVCGGTNGMKERSGCFRGLSPRVRGNPVKDLAPKGRDRSIPACAGEPVALVILNPSGLVYPRVCGGTVSATATRFSIAGLSPRVRGNLFTRWSRISV